MISQIVSPMEIDLAPIFFESLLKKRFPLRQILLRRDRSKIDVVDDRFLSTEASSYFDFLAKVFDLGLESKGDFHRFFKSHFSFL